MENENLGTYAAKRDFAVTPEPVGVVGVEQDDGQADSAQPRFVIQEHHARRLHWDFRLERNGVLVSWAVPRGVPADPRENHLAVPTEDHPLEYMDFAGEIPKGNYGAGRVTIWDRGTYDCHKWTDREVMVTLHGNRVQGRYVLFKTGEGQWMIHRMDPPQDPTREAMPEQIPPMTATPSGELPADDQAWAYEIKWDGVRTIAFISGGRVRLQSRRLLEATAQYPEVRALGEALSSHEVVLDGEIVALNDEGKPDFGLLAQRMNTAGESQVRRLVQRIPVVYMVFDLLYLDGHSTMTLPYRERRRLLDALELAGAACQVPAYHQGDGAALLAASRSQGLEGLVAKHLESPYEPGRRSRSWLKIKNTCRQELVIGGWLLGEAGRSGHLGALLVGYYEGDRLRYAGRVGSGFSQSELARLEDLLRQRAIDQSPFTPPPELPPEVRKLGHFVCPDLVAEVEFSEWTHTDTLRQPRYKGLRPDKEPKEVLRET